MKVLNFDSKSCERVREQLDAYLSNELLVETTATVLKHLEGCPNCSEELDSRFRLRDALRRAVEQQSPPEYLVETIHRRLRHTRPAFSWSLGFRHWMLALAGLAVMVIAGATAQHTLSLRRGRELVASVLSLGASDHIHCAIQSHNYPEVARPAAQLQARLGPEYAALLPVVEQKLSGFDVLEAHICTVPGSPRKYVHFIARGQGTILSVILTRREGEALPNEAGLVSETTDGVRLYRNHLKGMDVTGFETNGYFGFVVSDLGQDNVLQIAAAIAPALRTQLDAGQVSGADLVGFRHFLPEYLG
jgi:anti-sigma factor (TIGR02949 family)